MMHGREKSDSAIVAGKPTNKAVSTAAEPVEPRAEAKGNASQQSTRRTQSRVSVSQALERIRQAVTKNALPSHTQGGSRMPELGPYGSVRGALSNERPYRDLRNVVANYPFERSHRFAGIQPIWATETIRELRRWVIRSSCETCAGSSPSRRIAQIAEIAAILRQGGLANCATQRRRRLGSDRPSKIPAFEAKGRKRWRKLTNI
jgi:hypothetical protein